MVPDELLQSITGLVGDLDEQSIAEVSGGSISRSYRLTSRAGENWFLKVNDIGARDMFESERVGLTELREADAVRVPEAIECGVAGGAAFLLLEHLDFGEKSDQAAAALGARLARQHRQTSSACGWHRTNTIGSTPQINDWEEDWLRFFRYRRLGYQIDLAAASGLGLEIEDRGRLLLDKLPEFFEHHHPEPSLLHGDLWGGNWGALSNGEPAIFDPAVYYGDREADLAMTRLFGGFSPGFYDAYNESWPLDPGFEDRIDLYNLYHVLNHLNLFGGGYLDQASELIDRLLAR
jgi:protein-ribulosamine 3-kinase